MKLAKNFLVAILVLSFSVIGFIGISFELQDDTPIHLPQNIEAPHCNGHDTVEIAETASDSSLFINNAMTNYFYNLRNNYAYNQVGTCSYVSLEMLMDYFDNYVTDLTVPQQYEVQSYLDDEDDCYYRESPGSLSYYDTSFLTDNSVQNYYNRLSVNSGNSLHAKIILTASEMGYNQPEEGEIAVHIRYLYDIFQKLLTDSDLNDGKWSEATEYHDNFTGLTPNGDLTYSEQMRKAVIRLVKAGKPVLVDLRKYDDSENKYIGHAVVAYDYDAESDTLYYNFGWHGYSHVTAESQSYEYVYSYSCISYSGEHQHSDNYIINSVATCSCQLPTHIHSCQYQNINDFVHRETCYCGRNVLCAHRFVITTVKGMERKTCLDCGLVILYDGRDPIVSPLNIAKILLENL